MKVASALARARQLLRRHPPARAASSGSASASSGAAASTPFDAARAAHELELAKLADRAAARAQAAADREADRALGRSLWEILLGVKRETAQLMNLGFGGVVFIASGSYLVAGMVQETLAQLRSNASDISNTQKDVRALLANAHCAHPPSAPASRRTAAATAAPRCRAAALFGR